MLFVKSHEMVLMAVNCVRYAAVPSTSGRIGCCPSARNRRILRQVQRLVLSQRTIKVSVHEWDSTELSSLRLEALADDSSGSTSGGEYENIRNDDAWLDRKVQALKAQK